MVKHLFLTGEKGVGKSTLLRALLAGETCAVGGFVTVKSDAVFPGRISLHLLPAAGGETPSPENFLFFCPAPETGAGAENFERLGCAALASDKGAGLILMDEIGPREAQARRFQAAVLKALDGDVPVRGVLQRGDSEFLRAVAAHPKVRVVEVTRDNRETLRETLCKCE